MSDISIPGVTNKFDTAKIIENLMKIEKIPLNRMEDAVSSSKKKKNIWVDVNRDLSHLREISKTLYGFENPFQERVASSSDSSVLTANATREAAIDKKNIIILEQAAADKFLSSSLSKNLKVPEGTYGFSVGEKEVEFKFHGGSLSDFTKAINKKTKGLVKASIINDTSETYVILAESTKTGKENNLDFSGSMIDFALENNLLKKTVPVSRTLPLEENNIQPWGFPLSKEQFSIDKGILTLKPETELSLPFIPPVNVEGKLTLEIEVTVKNIEESISAKSFSNPVIPIPGKITFKGITVENEISQIDLPIKPPPPVRERIDDLQVLFLNDGGNLIALPEINDTETLQKINFQLEGTIKNLSSLNIKNRNTYRSISISGIRIFDPYARGEYTPVNPISQASNSTLLLDGIKVTRETNIIDDLIPGVTLNIHKSDDNPVILDIEPDMEKIKGDIISFIGFYNQLLANIQILTNTNETIIDEIEYYTDEEKEKALEKLGIFQGDMTLMQIKSKLQRILMDPYYTSKGKELTLLSQIGISTNAERTAGNLNLSKLRGYLEINESALDSVLEKNLTAVKELFGYDKDRDLAIDSGIAYSIDSYIKPYTQTGGIISYKISNLNSRISRSNKDIENYNIKLENKEEDLKRKYGLMEGALNSLEQSSKSIESFNKNNNN